MTLKVYNLIAQRDAQIGQRLAKDSSQMARASKRDSSAMKALSLLTMLFLPATFCASLFAMPWFDFSGPSGQLLVQSKFWLYWAATVPLTAIVLLIYTTYLFWMNRQRAREDEQGAEKNGQI